MKSESLKYISIVIPVYNEAVELEKTLKALQNQTYPKDMFEIIVVDNGSTDHTSELVKGFNGVKYILQTEFLNSSYSSRNRGIEKAKGDIVVLLDGTVIPEHDWLEKGIHCMAAQGADIATANVRFDYDGKVTAGKLYDTNNASTRRQVEKRGVAVTASLLVKKELFSELGLFPEGSVTAQDILWTRNATMSGYKLAFCEQSIAKKKAKTFRKLIKKQWRESKGYPVIWQQQGKKVHVYKKLLRSIIPVSKSKINRLLSNSGVELNTFQMIRFYFVVWIVMIVMSAGHIYGLNLINKKE